MELRINLNKTGWNNLMNKINANRARSIQLLKTLSKIIAFKEVIKHFKDKRGKNKPWPKRRNSTQERYGNIESGRWKTPSGYQAGMFNPGNELLVLTGNLRQAFSKDNLRQEGGNSVVLFNPMEYAGVHNLGNKAKGIPQRQFMWISKSGADLMAKGLVNRFLGDK